MIFEMMNGISNNLDMLWAFHSKSGKRKEFNKRTKIFWIKIKK